VIYVEVIDYDLLEFKLKLMW